MIQLILTLKMTTAQVVETYVSHWQQQQSYSGLRSPGRSNSTYGTFDIFILSDETPSAILEVIINWNVFDDSLTAHSF